MDLKSRFNDALINSLSSSGALASKEGNDMYRGIQSNLNEKKIKLKRKLKRKKKNEHNEATAAGSAGAFIAPVNFRGKNKITEALTRKEYAEYVNIGREIALSRINNIWPKLKELADFTNRSKDRLYFRLNTENYETPTWILNTLEMFGYEVKDYLKGIAAKISDGRLISIGKIFSILDKKNESDYLSRYEKERNNIVSGIDNSLIVISKHPYDIAGMSTDRGWTSCMDIRNPETNKWKTYLPLEIKSGTLIAYLVLDSDKNINRPISRISIRPYLEVGNPDNVSYGISANIYGANFKFFAIQLVKLLDYAQGEKIGIFKRVENTYPETDDKKFIIKNHPWISKADISERPGIPLVVKFQNLSKPEKYYYKINGGNDKVLNLEYAIWNSGVFKEGIISYSNFRGGTFEYGIFYKGGFFDGVWEDGLWRESNWVNGVWKKGYIYDDDIKEYVYSEVSPKEYVKNKKNKKLK